MGQRRLPIEEFQLSKFSMIHGTVAAAALLALGVANAAGPVKSAPAGVSPAVKLMPAAVLYDQNDNQGANSVTSQNFEASFDVYDTMAADDFTVPAGFKWLVNQVTVTGAYTSTGGATSAHVTFYKNKANLPQNIVADYPAAVITTDSAGSFVITVPKTALKPGKYWVGVQANLDFGVGGQWFWSDRTILAGAETAWQNPGNGFGTGCTVYAPLSTCIPATFDPDRMFAIGGKAKPI